MRASLMPGEDPMTLDTPEQVAEFIVPMCLPAWTENGRLYNTRAARCSASARRHSLGFRGRAGMVVSTRIATSIAAISIKRCKE